MSRSKKTNIEPRNELQIVYKNNILQPLKGFCTIVNSDCSFVEASRKLGLTPATLTKQVQSLEKALNMDLFDRTSSKCLKLTEMGQKFYDMGADVLARMDNLVYTFREQMENEGESILRIGTTPFMLEKLIPILSSFRDCNTNVKLDIHTCKKDEGVSLIKKNVLDVFVTSIETNAELSGDLEFIKLFDYIPYWMLWKGHPLERKKELSKSDLLKCSMIYDEDNTTMKSLRAFYEDNNIKSAMRLNNMLLEVQKELIRHKIGIWVIFNIFCTKKDTEEFVLKKATNLFPCGEYGLLASKFKKKTAGMFINFMIENKKDLFDETILD